MVQDQAQQCATNEHDGQAGKTCPTHATCSHHM
jgi:hypothetical protein